MQPGKNKRGISLDTALTTLILIFSTCYCTPLIAETGPATSSRARQIIITRDIDYLPGVDYADDKDRLDIFMPANAKGVPVIVYFHGGALRIGEKEHGEIVARRLVEQGFAVVTPNYRLSPGVMHPAHIEDAAAAFAWVSRHIGEYGGDDKQLYVGGHSAGAYLATLLIMDANHLLKHGLGLDYIRGGIAISPFLYVEETAPVRPKTVWGTNPEDWLKASVTPHIAGGKSPMLLVYADGDEDWRKQQIRRFTAAMAKLGNDISASEAPNRDHMSLVEAANAADDRIGKLVRAFIQRLQGR